MGGENVLRNGTGNGQDPQTMIQIYIWSRVRGAGFDDWQQVLVNGSELAGERGKIDAFLKSTISFVKGREEGNNYPCNITHKIYPKGPITEGKSIENGGKARDLLKETQLQYLLQLIVVTMAFWDKWTWQK